MIEVACCILPHMTTVYEYLIHNRDLIACNVCGNCCRGFHSPCEKLSEEGLCTVHPAVLGVDRREDVEPNCESDTDPVDMIQIGYFCPPLVDMICRLTNVRLQPTTGERGFRGGKIYLDRTQINSLLSRVVR